MPQFDYSGNPTSSQKDEVRYLIGDTDINDPLLYDEEIAYELAQGRSVLATAANCADSIAAKFSRKADKSVGDLQLSASQKSAQYRRLAIDLRARPGLSGSAVPWAGGISVPDKQNRELDTNRIAPAFTRELHNVPGREDTQTVTETRSA